MIPKSIILDTDIDTDCDDAGAVGILHGLARKGECQLLGTICSVPVADCVSTVRAINSWYGVEELLVGLVEVSDYETAPAWEGYRTHRRVFRSGAWRLHPYHDAVFDSHLARCGREANSTPDADAVTMYRRLLSDANAQSVTICAIGTLTALAQLLDSPPDQASPLSGEELVREKVAELVMMALATYPSGRDQFNWRMDIQAAAAVLSRWPGTMTVSEHGDQILTGSRFMQSAPADHPIRVAYETYLGNARKNRPSWDLVAVAYAVHGLSGPFALGGAHKLELDVESGAHRWLPSKTGPPRRYLAPTMDNEGMAVYLEDLLIDGV